MLSNYICIETRVPLRSILKSWLNHNDMFLVVRSRRFWGSKQMYILLSCYHYFLFVLLLLLLLLLLVLLYRVGERTISLFGIMLLSPVLCS